MLPDKNMQNIVKVGRITNAAFPEKLAEIVHVLFDREKLIESIRLHDPFYENFPRKSTLCCTLVCSKLD